MRRSLPSSGTADARWRAGRLAALGVLTATIGLAGWGLLVEPRRTRVRRYSLRLPGWPSALPGLRLVLVSDLHAGAPHVDEDRITRLVERMNAQRPDVVALLGDYVDPDVALGSEVAPESVGARLAGLRAPLGVYAVLGNGDWDNDGRRVARALSSSGVTVLENDPVRLAEGLWLVGLAYVSQHPHPGEALRHVPDDAAVILLTHHPDLFERVPRRVALTLAGHTHGGQVNVPLLRGRVVPSRFGERYAGGFIRRGEQTMYVSRGIGTSRLPVRLGVPPEIVVLDLSG